jgi:hypothetical protein
MSRQKTLELAFLAQLEDLLDEVDGSSVQRDKKVRMAASLAAQVASLEQQLAQSRFDAGEPPFTVVQPTFKEKLEEALESKTTAPWPPSDPPHKIRMFMRRGNEHGDEILYFRYNRNDAKKYHDLQIFRTNDDAKAVLSSTYSAMSDDPGYKPSVSSILHDPEFKPFLDLRETQPIEPFQESDPYWFKRVMGREPIGVNVTLPDTWKTQEGDPRW